MTSGGGTTARRRSRRRRRRRSAVGRAGRAFGPCRRPRYRRQRVSGNERPGHLRRRRCARWPDPHTGEHIRVEHWVVARTSGPDCRAEHARPAGAFNAVPFFWSQHYDVTIRYVGHAERWDRMQIDGSLDAHDASARFFRNDTLLAVATVGRDRECLQAELAFESSPENVT